MNKKEDQILEALLDSLSIPLSGYNKAYDRYKDIGEWVRRPESLLSSFAPHVYPQGSFRLGTVNRPLNPEDEYDLDMGCRLQNGFTKKSYSQKDLKVLIGEELGKYREARNIKQSLEEKKRCWRLQYADELKFHLDVVPSIPETTERKNVLLESMSKGFTDYILAQDVTNLTGAITDFEHFGYEYITDEWPVSNSQGYALWFESRIKLSKQLLERRAAKANVRSIEELPTYKWRSPLQECIRILKRHRDVMFQNNEDAKPISIIITTLAGLAYSGEESLAETLSGVIERMHLYINSDIPRIANPVNPKEDFADKWYDKKYVHLGLSEHFNQWLDQVTFDYNYLLKSSNINDLQTQSNLRFGIFLESKLIERIDWSNQNRLQGGRSLTIEGIPPKPWRKF